MKKSNNKPKIYTLPNKIGSGYGSLDDGPTLWSGPAYSLADAAARISRELDGIWINQKDIEVHDDPAYK